MHKANDVLTSELKSLNDAKLQEGDLKKKEEKEEKEKNSQMAQANKSEQNFHTDVEVDDSIPQANGELNGDKITKPELNPNTKLLAVTNTEQLQAPKAPENKLAEALKTQDGIMDIDNEVDESKLKNLKKDDANDDNPVDTDNA